MVGLQQQNLQVDVEGEQLTAGTGGLALEAVAEADGQARTARHDWLSGMLNQRREMGTLGRWRSCCR